jgi:putative transcriptional regulator
MSTETPVPDPAAYLNSPLVGRMLIAMPGIGDPRFERAVIFVCVQSPDHTLGIAINNPTENLKLKDVLGQLDISPADQAPDQTVLIGGPVETERGFVLHTDDFHDWDYSLPIGSGLSLSGTRDALAVLADPHARPSRSLLALGYSGWAPGQLEQELAHNVWLDADADLDIIFDQNHETKWARALAKLGVSPSHLAAEGGRA